MSVNVHTQRGMRCPGRGGPGDFLFALMFSRLPVPLPARPHFHPSPVTVPLPPLSVPSRPVPLLPRPSFLFLPSPPMSPAVVLRALACLPLSSAPFPSPPISQ